jgi:magnesium-transporting ATPase (P-type)
MEDGDDISNEIDYNLNNNFNVFTQGFILIMLSELGDKSQISTIYLSATVKPLHVFIASILAQYILSIMAVFFGNFISDKISERNLTIFAGIMFLIFACITIFYTLLFPVPIKAQAATPIPAITNSSIYKHINTTIVKKINSLLSENNIANLNNITAYISKLNNNN